MRIILLLGYLLTASLPVSAQVEIDSLGSVLIPGTFTTDVWGYVDSTTGREYAVVGDNSGSGISVVDVTDPASPAIVGTESTVPGFDVKVWKHYAYSVNGGGNGNGGIVDISDPTNPLPVGVFPSSHNIFISEAGFLYAEFPGLIVYDLNPDPTNPVEVWNGGSEGHDASVIGDRLYDFHGFSGTRIYDTSSPDSLVLLGTITDPAIVYHHSGYTSEDGQYLFICDELANHPTPDITVWDISDPANAFKVAEIADPDASTHNLYVIGDLAFVAYYNAGLKIFDISDPTQPQLLDDFDTNLNSGEGFRGAFGIYPFGPSGNILISDWDNGLFVFSLDSLLTSIDRSELVPKPVSLRQNYPNPFNPRTTIEFELNTTQHVELAVFNMLGHRVRTLVSGMMTAGLHKVVWDGSNQAGQQTGTGVYAYRLETADGVSTRKMILMK